MMTGLPSGVRAAEEAARAEENKNYAFPSILNGLGVRTCDIFEGPSCRIGPARTQSSAQHDGRNRKTTGTLGSLRRFSLYVQLESQSTHLI